MSHHHHHDHSQKRLGQTVALNIGITLAQGIAGLISGSLSLISDALHNFSDVVALLISYVAQHLTNRQPTKKQTFGYKRAEILAALVNASSLAGVSVFLIIEAIERFNISREVDSTLVIIFSGLGIVVNSFSAFMLRHEAKSNLNMLSAYRHLVSDAITSVAVMVGGILIALYNVLWIDSLLCILIALYLVYCSWDLLASTLRVLMHFTPDHFDLTKVESYILSYPQIKNVHHVHTWQLTDNTLHFEGHLDWREDCLLSEVSVVLAKLRKELCQEFGITHCLLQPEIHIKDSKDLVHLDGCN